MAQLSKRPKTGTDEAVDQVVKHIEEEPEEEKECSYIDPYYLIPSGSTLLNCALSDHYQGGYKIGTIVNTIGDSGVGKTLLALNILAEMSCYKRFDDYIFKFDDSEAALANNLKLMFGTEMADRIDLTRRSDTVQDLYANILRAIKDGRPFIYLLDSFDALTSNEEKERDYKLLEIKDKQEAGKEVKDPAGSYKMEKAKLMSEILRVIAREIESKEAFVNIISQTRDNTGWGFTDKTRSGGRALKFYSYHEMWASSVGALTQAGEKVGNNTKIQISKNKLTFKKRIVTVPIYDHYGIDDIGSCIDFLVEQKVWTKTKQTIKAVHFGWEGIRSNIINRIERSNLEQELSQIVGRAWGNKEDAIKIDRKRRYT